MIDFKTSLRPASVWRRLLVLSLVLTSTSALRAAEPFHAWAERPTMGWNSWDIYGTTVTETQTMAQANYMATHLKVHGWDLITVDIQWYAPNPAGDGNYYNYDTPNNQLVMDGFGRLQPATTRFPTAAGGNGFTTLASDVQALGLRFGIHIMRGIPRHAVVLDLPIHGTAFTAQDIADTGSTCPWNPDMYGVDMSKPGAQEYYDDLMQQYADWGVDFIKVDDISRPYGPNQAAEIEAIRAAIDKTGRPIVLSLSPGETPLVMGAHVMVNANQWRISDDFWDNWGPLYDQFQRLHDWTPYRGPGFFPDADMLPLGKVEASGGNPNGRPTNFSQDEQHTLMSLWSIARSPLIHGGDMTQMDSFTLGLFTNDEVIAVNQRSTHNRQLFRNGNQIAWVADDEDSDDKYLAVFNTGGTSTTVAVDLADLGFTASVGILSLWDQVDLGSFTGTFSPSVNAHGAKLFRLSGVSLPTPWITVASAAEAGVTVGWEEIPTADSYTLKRGNSEAGPFLVVASGLTSPSHLDATVADRTGYYYVVSATVSGEEGPDSGPRYVISDGVPDTVSWNYDAWSTVGGDGAGSLPPLGAEAGADRAGAWSQTYPNNPVTNLRDALGGATSLDISYSSTNGGYWMQGSHPGQDSDGSWNKEMLNGYLNAGGGGSSSVTITEIPHGTYDLYVYFSSDTANREGRVSDGTSTYFFRTIGSASISGANAVLTPTNDTVDDPQDDLANYAVFRDLVGTEQTVTVTIPNFGGIAGFQVVPVNDGPGISDQPDPVSLLAGNTVQLGVVATGSENFSYQWFKVSGGGDVALANGGRISGATSADLEITGVTSSDAGQYYVVVTDETSAPLITFASTVATVSVLDFEITSSTIQPQVDPDDESFFPGTVADADNIDAGYDPHTYIAHDTPSQGMSFTTGGNPGGYTLGSITIQQVLNQTWADVQPGDLFSFAFGTLEGTTKTPLYQAPNAIYAGTPINNGFTAGGGIYLTFDLSQVGEIGTLSPNTQYYFEVAAKNGTGQVVYIDWNGASAGGYDAGEAFSGDLAAEITPGYVAMTGDRAFHADLTAVVAPADDFASWIGNYPGVGAMTGVNQDPDHDGIPSGVENFFGTDPSEPTRGIRVVARSGNTLTFQHPRNASPASDLSAAYRWSPDLAVWHPGGVDVAGTTVNFAVVPDTPSPGVVTVIASIAGAVPDSVFARIEVSASTP
ncbi:MAG: hypothetical protein KDN05_02945 [Verrucomicrobiae bacterium]|nr:hypothetical protein [Verrucomicrobiae bacterium]